MASSSVRYGDLLRASHRRAIRSARGSARTAIGLNDPQIVSRSARTAAGSAVVSGSDRASISGMAGSIERGLLLRESVSCCLDPCKRFAHCRCVSRPFIKIVVTCVDAALKYQVRDRGAERRAASCWHDGVALRYDERRRHEDGSNELNGRHAMAENKADRSPPV